MLDLLACRENFPLLIHCASGKDRTGYGAAVILMTAGASREVILEDYALTNLYRREIKHLLAPTTPQSMIQMLTSAQPKYLEAAFEVIDRRYGSIDGYLERGLGLDAAKRARLVELLTEPESAVVPG
jgi:protein-tyrosine phosphatase